MKLWHIAEKLSRSVERIEGACYYRLGPYLTRYYLLGSSTSRWALMLHCFHRGDVERDLHDHPWNFYSLILKNGYFETTGSGTKWQGPGKLLIRPSTWRHRVSLHSKEPAWTLVFRTKKKKSWGFWTDRGFVNWRNYDYNGDCA